MSSDLERLVRDTVESMRYEFVGVELSSRAKTGVLLRVYIDKEGGVDVEDCARVSRQLSAVLDVEDPIAGRYRLEVSSPGLDRPLFEKAHFERFAGHRIKLVLSAPLEGQRNFKGVLRGVEDDEVILDLEDEQLVVPIGDIAAARLIPEFQGRGGSR